MRRSVDGMGAFQVRARRTETALGDGASLPGGGKLMAKKNSELIQADEYNEHQPLAVLDIRQRRPTISSTRTRLPIATFDTSLLASSCVSLINAPIVSKPVVTKILQLNYN